MGNPLLIADSMMLLNIVCLEVIMAQSGLEQKLDLLLSKQHKSTILTQLSFSWTSLIVGYTIGLIAPTAFVLGVSNIIIVFSSLLFIISLIRFIRSLKKA